MNYFNISTQIVDRTDLTIYEKMACVVMARYANRSQFDGLLNIAVIADKMGVTQAMAQKALDQLVEKGLLTLPKELLIQPFAEEVAQRTPQNGGVQTARLQEGQDAPVETAEEPLSQVQSDALLAKLAGDVPQDLEVKGRRLNSQINMSRVKKLYAKKK